MRATIAVPGRFHAFHTAEQLARREALRAVLTPLPWGRVRGHTSLPRGAFAWLPTAAVAEVLARRAPESIRRALFVDALRCEVFDRAATRALPADTDIFVGYAGSCLHSMKKARSLGARTVVERHSAHRVVQMELLREEHAHFNLPFRDDPHVMRRELEEYELADAICIPSSFVAHTFQREGIGADRLIQVPLGVDLSRFFPEPRLDNTFRVVFAGVFNLQKGVQYLLAAWKMLAYQGAELVFVGSVSEQVRRILRPDLVPGVRLVDRVSQEKLREIFCQADVLCLPSVQDGFGTVIPQAMACGLAIVHSSNTGGADVVRPGRDGFEVPARDSFALAQALERCMHDREMTREMGRSALDRVRSFGGWDQYGDAIHRAYLALLHTDG